MMYSLRFWAQDLSFLIVCILGAIAWQTERRLEEFDAWVRTQRGPVKVLSYEIS